jgi:Tol biopolymer transport system component
MRSLLFLVFSVFGLYVSAQESFEMMDIFQLQYANDVQISPNGKQIVYRKMGFDLIEDRAIGNLWIYEIETGAHYKLTPFDQSESSPRWSPNGDRIAFTASGSKGSEIYIYWVAQQSLARITQLSQSPGNLSWSPTGEEIAFSSFVPEAPPIVAKIPAAPKGAKWAAKPRITDRLKHEADGRGYMSPGFTHIFKVSALGGAVQQLTEGRYNHRGPISWSVDGNTLFFSGNRNDDWEYDFRNSEIYTVSSSGGEVTAITDREGPDRNATVSPDGKKIAYLGYTDKREAFQNTQLHIMNLDGSDVEVISDHLDINISAIAWDTKSQGMFISYDHHGNGKIAHLSLNKKLTHLAENLGGTSLGRPLRLRNV